MNKSNYSGYRSRIQTDKYFVAISRVDYIAMEELNQNRVNGLLIPSTITYKGCLVFR